MKRKVCSGFRVLVSFHRSTAFCILASCGLLELLALKREKDNDERQLRKLSRKLHQHANARREALARATNATPEQLEADQQTIIETFENVQVELDAFLLLVEKLELVRLAERRQAEEYEIMRGNICKFCWLDSLLHNLIFDWYSKGTR